MRKGYTVAQEHIIDYDAINKAIGLNNIQTKKPTLIVSSRVHNYIKVLHRKYTQQEWLGVCKVEKKADWVFMITDMIHPEQKATGWDVNTTEKWMDWAVEYLTDIWEDLWKWNCILHSHHHMGCFWSWTDDKARLELNDGRFVEWAVVTAYSWDRVDYKGCVNFYRPYNIEIDCDMVAETETDYVAMWEIYKTAQQEYEKTYQEKLKEHYARLLEENATLLNSLVCYNYAPIVEYLWMDIMEDLELNWLVIGQKLPCTEMEKVLNNLREVAKTEVENEIGTFEIDDDYLSWKEWHEDLEEQLEKALVKTYTYSSYTYDNRWKDWWESWNSGWYGRKYSREKEEEKEKKEEKALTSWEKVQQTYSNTYYGWLKPEEYEEEEEKEMYYDNEIFNEEEYTEDMLYDYWIPRDAELTLDVNWVRMVKERGEFERTYVGEWFFYNTAY